MLAKLLALLTLLWNPYQPFQKQARRQEIQLRTILIHAYRTVPYYKRLFDAHFLSATALSQPNALEQIPITTKQAVKAAGNDMLSSSFPREKLIRETTSGSTGKPLELFKTRSSLNLAKASKLRTYLINGYRVHEKIAEINFDPTMPKGFHKFGIHRTYGVPFDATLPEQVAQLRTIRPQVISAYPSRIYELMCYLKKEAIRDIRPRLLFTQAEALTRDRRRALHDWFGIEPHEIYSSQEFQYIAWECRAHQGLHINTDLLYLEIMKPDGSGRAAKAGELGYVVITDFTNFGMPLIRYNMEDLASLSPTPCSCGVQFPLLQQVSGRKIGLMRLPDGRWVPGDGVVSTVLSEQTEIEHFSCRQIKDGSLLLEVVALVPGVINEKSIRLGFEKYCGPIRVTIKEVSKIQKTNAGKLLPFISELEKSNELPQSF